ncbi:MAG TPA: hypothetical protein DCX54_10040 [Flavobacteriales bacterium]|nr:hypothetical protein [Flavobacteriales bacterium]
MRFVRIILSLLCLFYFTLRSHEVYSQKVYVSGQVKGLTNDHRKTKPVILSNVNVTVALDNKPFTVKTNLAGIYALELERDKHYLMTVSREDYNHKSLYINTKNIPLRQGEKGTVINDLDFILLKADSFPDDISLKEDMGQLVFSEKNGNLQLIPNEDFRKNMHSRDFSLKLVKRNIASVEHEVENNLESDESESPALSLNKVKKDSVSLPGPDPEIKPIISYQERVTRSEGALKSRRAEIDSAKVVLENLKKNAQNSEDSLRIRNLEALILAAEIDLQSAEEVISFQKKELSLQSRLITFYVICMILLVLVIGVVFYFYRDKAKTNLLLAEKNRTITEGINYANRIQGSILKSEEELRSILPELFLMFRPRDIVSGDFYWVSRVNEKIVASAIDCTGHGVPGAFISMIGNTLLNEIVNNKKTTDPSIILEELHKGVLAALQQDVGGKQAQDGMDMALVVIDRKNKSLEFAGAKNHMIKITNGKLELIRADIHSIGGRALRKKDGYSKSFKTTRVLIENGSTFYLFSDGYMDQFGGAMSEKFNLPQFKDLLIKCSTKEPEEQKRLLNSTFETWKGKNDQLDDVLIMGLKF